MTQAYPQIEVLELRTMSNALARLVENPVENKIEIIKKIICQHYLLTWEQINVMSRNKDLVRCRHLIAYFIHKNTSMGPSLIARFFDGRSEKELHQGKKHHTSIMHAIRAIDNLLATNKAFRIEFETLEQEILSEINLVK